MTDNVSERESRNQALIGMGLFAVVAVFAIIYAIFGFEGGTDLDTTLTPAATATIVLTEEATEEATDAVVTEEATGEVTQEATEEFVETATEETVVTVTDEPTDVSTEEGLDEGDQTQVPTPTQETDSE